MNYLAEAIIRTKELILTNKKKFLILFLAQTLLLILMFSISGYYQAVLFADLQQALVPLQQANLDQDSLEAGGQFLQDAALLLSSYRSLVSHAWSWLTGISLLFLTINGWLWVLSFNLIKKANVKQLIRWWLNYAAAGLFLLLLFYVAATFILRNIFTTEDLAGAFSASARNLFITAMALYFLFQTAIAASNQNSWKLFITKIGRMRSSIHYLLPVFIINWGILSLNIFFIFKAGERYLLALLLVILLVIALIITRIFWLFAASLVREQ